MGLMRPVRLARPVRLTTRVRMDRQRPLVVAITVLPVVGPQETGVPAVVDARPTPGAPNLSLVVVPVAARVPVRRSLAVPKTPPLGTVPLVGATSARVVVAPPVPGRFAVVGLRPGSTEAEQAPRPRRDETVAEAVVVGLGDRGRPTVGPPVTAGLEGPGGRRLVAAVAGQVAGPGGHGPRQTVRGAIDPAGAGGAGGATSGPHLRAPSPGLATGLGPVVGRQAGRTARRVRRTDAGATGAVAPGTEVGVAGPDGRASQAGALLVGAEKASLGLTEEPRPVPIVFKEEAVPVLDTALVLAKEAVLLDQVVDVSECPHQW